MVMINYFKSTLQMKIAKKVAVMYLLLTLAGIVLLKNKWTVLAGLTFGSLISLARFYMLDRYITRSIQLAMSVRSLLLYVLHYMRTWVLAILLMGVSLLLGLSFFLGSTVGILLVPLTITFCAFLQALGLIREHL